ncbi:putative 115 kDa protein in type-1 retrotransposable element R1DM [Caerostris darwini]|uniref:115 kDa protein in type-1 retrotransposable element R1DM n=1 Tax=Caerostris darwini TaxID=1538125 RepID=A0AAV4W7G9_9ARAC|nr:putative 115 kDa protein in type-1 retrotransposable element R1DM [Caerostris darwini]
MANKLPYSYIKGGHLNLGNARAAMAFLNNSFAEHDYDFFSLNEPYSFQDKITNIPKTYKIAAFHSSPKAAIAIKAAFNSQSIHITREVVVILAKIHNTDFLLASIYCPPSSNIEVNLNSLIPFLNKYSETPMIILGDFNAKSRVWGQRNLDERGSKLLMFCNQQDLNIENSPDSPPTFTSTRGESWIDLLLTKNITADISLEILDEVTNSDHNLLVLKYPLQQITPRKNNRIYLKASNWLAIKTAISGIIDPNLDIDQLTDNEISSHIKTIQNKIFEATSTRHISRANPNHRKKKKSAVWWTSELEIKRSKTRALRRQYQKERDQQSRQNKKLIYKKNLSEYKKLILNTKKSKFKDFINSIPNNSLFGKNYNIITNEKKRSTIGNQLIKPDGTLSNSIEESTTAILDFHFPWSNLSPFTTSQPDNRDLIPTICQEIEAIIARIKPNKAPCPDGLPGEIIKEIFHANKAWFTSLFNNLLLRGFFPEPWRIARLVLIDKDNKKMDHPSHFRPICLLPCWGKVLDKLIPERLSYHLESDQILSDNQYGFRKNRSTVLALQNIPDFHEEASNSQQMTCLISIDMPNAFNAVDWNLLNKKIQSINLPKYIKSIIQLFLSERQVCLHDQTKKYNRGIPQGSSLGPILWNVFINDLLQKDFGPNIKIQAFADDILLMLKAPATYCFTNNSKEALSTIDSWTKENLMTINHSKSVFSILSRKRFTHIPSIKIGNNRFQFQPHFKYLGVVIDSKLLWNHHLNSIQDKLHSLQQKLYRITRDTWGLTPLVKKEIFLKVINRIILYGHEIWYQGKVKQNVKIGQLQRSGRINITNSYRTVSTEALQVLAGVPPLDIQLKHLHKIHLIKLGRSQVTINGLTIQPNSIAFRKPFLKPWTKTAIKWNHFSGNMQGTLIYTDGSKMNDRVGGAFAVLEQDRETFSQTFRLSDSATVYMAELAAIEKAIDYAIKHSKSPANIISDSRSVLLALENLNNLDPSILLIKNKIMNYTGQVRLFWIKAHVGHMGNERADVLAKEATNSPDIQLSTDADLHFIKQLIKKDILAEWQDRWSNSTKGREVFILLPKSSSPRSHGGAFHAEIRPTHVLGGSPEPQLCLSGLLLQSGHFVFGRLPAGRNDN